MCVRTFAHGVVHPFAHVCASICRHMCVHPFAHGVVARRFSIDVSVMLYRCSIVVSSKLSIDVSNTLLNTL